MKRNKKDMKLPLVRQSIRLLQAKTLEQAQGGLRRIEDDTCDMGRTCVSNCH